MPVYIQPPTSAFSASAALLEEDFEAVTPGALPDGWTLVTPWGDWAPGPVTAEVAASPTGGQALMFVHGTDWASYGAGKYTQGFCRSASGRVSGPWVQVDEPLFADDGGHGMLFHTFDGRLVMVLHQPNREIERARFFEMEDTGDAIRIAGELVGGV